MKQNVLFGWIICHGAIRAPGFLYTSKSLDFQWTIVSWLLIPKIQEKEYCLYIREAVVFYCDTTPLYLSEPQHKSLCMLGALTIVPHHFLLWWLSTDEEICLLNMISPFLAHLCPNIGCCEIYKYLATKL